MSKSACGLKGNAVDYLVALKGLNRTEALRVLEERYGGPQRAAEEGGLAAEVRRILDSHDVPEEPRAMIFEEEYVSRSGSTGTPRGRRTSRARWGT